MARSDRGGSAQTESICCSNNEFGAALEFGHLVSPGFQFPFSLLDLPVFLEYILSRFFNLFVHGEDDDENGKKRNIRSQVLHPVRIFGPHGPCDTFFLMFERLGRFR